MRIYNCFILKKNDILNEKILLLFLNYKNIFIYLQPQTCFIILIL